MLSMITNTPVQEALTNLDKTQKRMAKATESLSSGQRINSAADDAAGSAIANRMTANMRADSTLARGINDGIGLMQVAEGGLNSINKLLQRSRELAVQAANGTLSKADRASLNDEYQQMREEIDRIARGTEAFGNYPLAPGPVPAKLGNTPSLGEKFQASGSGTPQMFASGIVSTAYIPAGAKNVTFTIDSLGADDDIQLFNRNGEHLVGTPINGSNSDIVWSQNQVTDGSSADSKVLTTANGFLPGASYSDANLLQGGATYDINGGSTASYNGMTFTYSGDGDRYEDATTGIYNDGVNGLNRGERLHIDQATEDLLIMVVGQGSFTATASWDAMPTPMVPPPPPSSSPVNILVSASYGEATDSITIEPTPADSTSLDLDDVALDPIEKAREAMTKLQNAMNKVDGYRSQYGALTNRFEGTIDNLAQQSVNMAAARSRIMDTDYASASAELAKTQILQKAGNTVLAQANQMPKSVLSLLQ